MTTNPPSEVPPARGRSFARAAALVAAASALTGCGLLLDAWPPDPVLEDRDAAVNGCVSGDCRDARGDELDAGQDRDTGGGGVDADPSDLDGGRETTDGGVRLDATASVDGSLDAGSSGEAGASTDAAASTDTGRNDSGSAFVCVGVHPIVGPPRTCEAGSCLCSGIDTCFTAEEVRMCCADDFTCAAPLPECMGVHPIIGGATRTCERGSCYCGNPDSCFPADRATRCCAVDVVCVL